MQDTRLNELLGYHQELTGAEFNQQIIKPIMAARKRRKFIVLSCCLIGALLSGIYVWSSMPAAVVQQLVTPLNAMVVFSLGLFLIWLWTETLADG